ncbi:hypothetical protein NEOLEDRAFT_964299 [Neolentinus lepideus HHB14362 ss-1]|uniref:Uncharacterized protein n=1 Tax=Neolentinus lepideus HHB14362 ss-1 TaxID=1314782 RepID=A0A165UHH4_9AGAM|nr:hypothetical protein NEOLEDRAFT_964299 [Neolentinus lepideus HHB14362 ss-1]
MSSIQESLLFSRLWLNGLKNGVIEQLRVHRCTAFVTDRYPDAIPCVVLFILLLFYLSLYHSPFVYTFFIDSYSHLSFKCYDGSYQGRYCPDKRAVCCCRSVSVCFLVLISLAVLCCE